MEEYAFTTSELQRMAALLRSVFAIRTIDGEEDELLGDFIEALENADVIYCDEDDEEQDGESFDIESFGFPFLPRN